MGRRRPIPPGGSRGVDGCWSSLVFLRQEDGQDALRERGVGRVRRAAKSLS